MGYLLIVVFTLLNLAESIFVKTYAKRHGSGGMLMNAIIALFASSFFLITDEGGFYAPTEMLPYAIINALLYAAGFYSAFVAFKIGPYGLTRLISNFSLTFSIFYGIFFLNEPTTAFTYIGIALIFVAMFLINYKGKSAGDTAEGGISLKWFIYIIITVLSNGFLSIITRMQQIKFDNACSNEFQFIAIGGSFIILATIGLITDRHRLGPILKHGTLYGIGAGICNGAKNFVTLAIYLYLPLSTVSPLKTSLGMIAAFVVSLIFYKEKYTKRQVLGVLCGVIAVVMLTLK